ncbi:MAG: hypothetical protein ACI9C9_001055, partial [Marivirga sp.]
SPESYPLNTLTFLPLNDSLAVGMTKVRIFSLLATPFNLVFCKKIRALQQSTKYQRDKPKNYLKIVCLRSGPIDTMLIGIPK